MPLPELKKHILMALAFDWAKDRLNEVLGKEDPDLRLRILEEIGKGGGAFIAEMVARTALHAGFGLLDGADPPPVVVKEMEDRAKVAGGMANYKFDINASGPEAHSPVPTSRRPSRRRGGR